MNGVAVLSLERTDVSRGGVNGRWKRKAERSVERMTLRVGHVWIQ